MILVIQEPLTTPVQESFAPSSVLGKRACDIDFVAWYEHETG